MTVKTLPVFTSKQKVFATDLLSAKIATMLGRKMEEGDWDFVYCNSKNIPITDWSNLHIDINHNGLGVEHKMLRVTKPGTILEQCGTTKMHPAGTRSIRIPNKSDSNKAMADILKQYGELINSRTKAVIKNSKTNTADMRIGWLLWKDTLEEFLYFEEPMLKPNISDYYAEWSVTPARGARKESRSLWIYENATGKKKYSVTTTAGAKIQPYFDVPAPNDPNLYYFKVQGVNVDGGLIKVWLTRSTAKYLELLLGSLESDELSEVIEKFDPSSISTENRSSTADEIAVSILVREESYKKLKTIFNPISDEYMFQQLAINLGER
ncbi:MAG: hypothetical protein ACNA7G_03215 [Methylobacter sp.]